MQHEKIENAFLFNQNASLNILIDAFNERLEKLTALVHVSLCEDFSDFPKEITYSYRTLISDLINELRTLSAEVMQRDNKEI